MKAGDLRDRVGIQTATDTTAADGSSSRTWATTSERWAGLRGLTGREILTAGDLRPAFSHEITMRYDASVTSKNRLTMNSRTFEITSINYDPKREWMTLQVNEVQV